jgi:hypothetical protein
LASVFGADCPETVDDVDDVPVGEVVVDKSGT